MKVNEVNKWLFEVEHPAKGDKNIVELGMVENVEIGEGSVTVTLAFSKHRDPLAEYLIGSAKAAETGLVPTLAQNRRCQQLRQRPPAGTCRTGDQVEMGDMSPAKTLC